VAVPLAFRLAIAVAPAVGGALLKVVKWSEGPGVASAVRIHRQALARLSDPATSTSESVLIVEQAGATLADVVIVEAPFELRKAQVTWSFAGGSAGGEDVRVCTFHLLKLAAGVPQSNWVESDFTTFESAFDTFWAALLAQYRNTLVLSQIRWYKAGPAITPPQEPVRVVDRNAAGGNTISTSVPPQVALTVTERTAVSSKWGRFYLPAPMGVGTNYETGTGRFTSGWLTTVANAADALYEACRNGNVPIVVYSGPKPERSPTADPPWRTKQLTLPPQVGMALTVDKLQVDDVPDVIRSRRHGTTLLRVQRDVAA
jgi:hypothetical protein